MTFSVDRKHVVAYRLVDLDVFDFVIGKKGSALHFRSLSEVNRNQHAFDLVEFQILGAEDEPIIGIRYFFTRARRRIDKEVRRIPLSVRNPKPAQLFIIWQAGYGRSPADRTWPKLPGQTCWLAATALGVSSCSSAARRRFP